MLWIDGLCEYEKREENPEIQRQVVMLKKNGGSLRLDIPHHGLVSIPLQEDSSHGDRYHTESLKDVLMAHGSFRIAMQTWTPKQNEDPLEQAVGEVKAISLFFPDVRSKHLRICMAAWLGVLCTVDDLLEAMRPHEAEDAILATIATLQDSERDNKIVCEVSPKANVCSLMSLFQKHCCRYLSDAAAKDFFREICTVFCGFMQEIDFQQGYLKRDMENYMEIRTRTIGVAPFFSLIRCDLFPADYYSDSISAIQKAVNIAVGLQNDLVGLEKDLEEKEPMNAVFVSMEELLWKEEVKGTKLADTIAAVCSLHNCSIAEVAQIRQRILQTARDESEIIVATSQLLFTETHFRWCTTAKRYRTHLE
ncbi:uncharacterized protein N7500_006897 [Penicillium coprophilum]|uniref:uncharacterized protein n=1 Tax=Penicillium coprophilum TaxID=36646 RepID=UPI002383FA89|nr:uncharacterized protein N7500_006897 [Penicillium coprophilum]KAJ5165067.1 hypothetical protein N7500_006897 [Penicillium coprophilum]